MTVRRYAALAAVLTGGACASLPFYRDRADIPPPANVAADHPPTQSVSTPLEAPRIAVESGDLNPIITRSPLPDSAAVPPATAEWHQPSSILPVADDAPLPLLPHFPVAPRTAALNISGARIHEPDFSQSEPPATIPTAVVIAPTALPPKLHRIVDGDSLSLLALRYLGDERRSSEIVALNRGVIHDPHLLPVGKEIAIPRGQIKP